MKPQSFFLAAFASFCCAAILFAQTTEAPRKINFQGKLNNPTQGPVNLTLSIYKTATGGTAEWSETQNNVPVLNGIFNVLLGSVTLIPNAVFKNGGDLFLEIKVGNNPLSKRVQIASVAYAVKATLADTAKVTLSGGGGLTLPYSATSPSGSTLFSLISTGLGPVGTFEIQNPNSNNIALVARTNGLNAALRALTTGSNSAGAFEIANPSNSFAALFAQTNGTGRAGLFLIDNPSNSLSVLHANTNGMGGAGYFEIKNTSNTDATLFATTNGNGPALKGEATGSGYAGDFQGRVYVNGNVGIGTTNPAAKLHIGGTAGVDGIRFPDGTLQTTAATGTGGGLTLPYSATSSNNSTLFSLISAGLGSVGTFEIQNPNSNNIALVARTNGRTAALRAVTTGSNSAGAFEIENPSNSFAALFAQTNGTGRAGLFLIDNPSNSLSVLHANTNGMGGAGYFEIKNTNNTDAALSATTNGLGDAGYFEINNPNNTDNALFATTNGIESAIYGYTTGSGHAGTFKINNTSNNFAALFATTNGSGPALKGEATGSGYAGDFQGRVFVNGNVGIRTENPVGILDVAIPSFGFVRLGQNAVVSEVQFTNGRIRSEVAKFQILGQDLAGDAVSITFGQFANDIDMMIATNGDVGIGTTNPTDKLYVQGNIRATGSITPGSSREFKENIAPLSLQEATSTLAFLNPVKFKYKTDEQKDLHVGFIAEEVPDLLATPDRKGVDPMDVIAVLTKVVQDQQKELAALREEVNALKQQKR